MDLNDRRFVTIENNSGLSSDETVFHYFQNGDIITGRYQGGAILEGNLVGKQVDGSKIQLLFQCLTQDRELKVGESTGTISRNPAGKLQLKFDWRWLNGDLSGGKSEYIEID
ncbi:MAG TPA: hypothetical protein DCE41_29450 [Cytophagales bacterium]|nr:hypothetical protein [Cytophagales bacterium]HAA18571.1 hypothetical protein [Cytophagales bacterium]HAP60201.1 hypothetical protein [Cytophagales bacterium]